MIPDLRTVLFINGAAPNLQKLVKHEARHPKPVMSLHRCKMSNWDGACVYKPSVTKCRTTIRAGNSKNRRPIN